MSEKNERINVRGVYFDNLSREEAFERVKRLISGGDRAVPDGGGAATSDHGAGAARAITATLVTPNSEIVQGCVEDPALYEVINSASLIVPDGIGVIYASKLLGRPLKEKVAGVELAERIVRYLAEQSLGLYILGGARATGSRESVAALAARRLREKYPGLVISGTRDGYFTQRENDGIIEEINASGARVLFVCLGAPKQEKWIFDNREKLRVSLAAGLGGSADVFAGTARRAPDFFVKSNLEWLYRLLRNPSRIGRMTALPKFLIGTISARKTD